MPSPIDGESNADSPIRRDVVVHHKCFGTGTGALPPTGFQKMKIRRNRSDFKAYSCYQIVDSEFHQPTQAC